jgi:UDP-N-acetyl-2-amino-2-deoxyglucuronate dehydrogenase
LIRFGIVGCGAIFPLHAEALSLIDRSELTTVFDVDPGKKAFGAERFNCREATSMTDLFDHCDAVIVCTPSGLHAELGIQAANAGKHVLVEKPIDTTLEKAQTLVDAARMARVKLSTVSQHRFARPIQLIRKAAQDGGLGALLAGDAYIKWYRTQAYYDSGDWRGTKALDGGGCLINQGIHMIDMIQWIMGGIQSVQAQIRTSCHDIEVEDIAQVLVEYRNGATGVIYGSTAFYPGVAERLEIHGRHGSVVAEGDRIKAWKVDAEAAGMGLYGTGVMAQPTPKSHAIGELESRLIEESRCDSSCDWGEQHRLQIEDFTRAIVDDCEPFITGEDSLQPLKAILAMYRSAAEGGRRVQVKQPTIK